MVKPFTEDTAPSADGKTAAHDAMTEHDAILKIFRDVLGTQWCSPDPEVVRGDVASIAKSFHKIKYEADFLKSKNSSAVFDALRTLRAKLPAFIAEADEAVGKIWELGEFSLLEVSAKQARQIYNILCPYGRLAEVNWVLEAGKRWDQRSYWHGHARALAPCVIKILRAGTSAKRISLQKPNSPAIKIIKELLTANDVAVTPEAVVEVFRDRQRTKGG